MIPFYVMGAINRYCKALKGKPCGDCQIVDLCLEDIEEYKKSKGLQNGYYSIS